MSYKMADINGSELIEGAMNDLRLFHVVKPLTAELNESAAVTVDDVKAVLMMLTRERRWTVIAHP